MAPLSHRSLFLGRRVVAAAGVEVDADMEVVMEEVMEVVDHRAKKKSGYWSRQQ